MSGRLYIGTAGWSYKDWSGNFYPEKMPSGMDRLTYLAGYFDTVEVNSSFYRIPPAKFAEGWIKKVNNNPNFRFTLKLWQEFTHSDEYPSDEEIKFFKEALDVLLRAKKLGAVLIQFPWSFKCSDDNKMRLEKIFDDFADYPRVLEVRHKSWDTDEFLEFLEEKNVSFCNIDQPVIGDSIPPTDYVTGGRGYVRLHGRNYKKWIPKGNEPAERYNYLYSAEELEPWVDRIRNILNKKIDTYVITNNHWKGKAAHTALMIKHKITGERVKGPESLKKTYPDLEKIYKTEGDREQSNLFGGSIDD